MLNKWVEEWNKRIAYWIEEGPCDMGLAHILDAYSGGGKKQLELHAMPEPYVGNPLSTEPIDAVMLTYNPGASGIEQHHPNGSIVSQVRHSTYYEIASTFMHPNTKKWWEGRSKWPARLLEMEDCPCKVVGIDLFPWHSEQWGTLNFTPEVLPWFKENVLRPAAMLGEGSSLSKHYDLGYPLVLAIGSHHAHILTRLGFTQLNKNNDSFSVTSNITANRRIVKRNIRIFVSDNPLLAVLQTDAKGTFLPPGMNFDNSVNSVLYSVNGRGKSEK